MSDFQSLAVLQKSVLNFPFLCDCYSRLGIPVIPGTKETFGHGGDTRHQGVPGIAAGATRELLAKRVSAGADSVTAMHHLSEIRPLTTCFNPVSNSLLLGNERFRHHADIYSGQYRKLE